MSTYSLKEANMKRAITDLLIGAAALMGCAMFIWLIAKHIGTLI